MTLRVLVDATAVPVARGGVGRYLDDLLPALGRRDVDLLVLAQAHDVPAFRDTVPAAEVFAAPAWASRPPARLLWEQVGLPLLVRRLGVAVLHSPHYTMPLAAGVPVVVTLHDATFFTDPAVHSPVKARFFRAATRIAARLAAGLVVPSEATAREVTRVAGVDPKRTVVAPHGVDRKVFHPPSPEDVDRVAGTLGLQGRSWVAFLGTIEPRKNVPALIRGWVHAVQDLPDPPALVLAGGAGWDLSVDPAVAAVPSGLTIIRSGYLPLEDLPGLLGGADVVAYPSLGEGFGLPVLESMACGAAVLTTDRLSLPEVGGDAVEYCGTDERSIATALARLLSDAPARETLRTAAQERAATFTWDRAAAQHVEAYARALQRGPWWRRR